nr:putative retrotransposon polyprotein [Ipomoea batatas]
MSSMASTSEQGSIIAQMEKMMTMMKDLSDRLQNIENQRVRVENEGVQNHEGGNQEERRGREITRYNSLPRMLPRRFVEERVDNNLSSLRMEMPTFNGDDEPEVFLNWVDEVEDIFGLHNFGEEKKFKTAIASLKDFAKLWWKQLSRRRLEDQDEPIETWGELKREMRRKFVPSNFYRDMRRKLQELKQGNESVREFYKEMERLKTRANIQEDDETTIARILEGFNRDIRRELRNQEFDDVDKLVRVASKVEDELRSERGSKPSVSSQWDQPRRATNNSYQSRTQKEYSRPSHTQKEKKNNQREKEKFQEGSKQKVSTVTCYRCQGRGHYARECPNTKKILTTGKDEREYMSANESDDEELEPNGERQKDDHSEEEVQEDDALHFNCVVHKALSTLVVLDQEEQRENIFYGKCKIPGATCSFIIDGGSCTNVISEDVVNAMKIPTIQHPQPYKLQWLNDDGELKVHKQALISISIGKYQDDVLCDVIPMHACHILLGRPWQYDRDTLHHGKTNKYTIHKGGKKYTLTPLAPKEVYNLQVQSKKLREELAQKAKEAMKETTSGKQNTIAHEKKQRKEGMKKDTTQSSHNLLMTKGEVEQALRRGEGGLSDLELDNSKIGHQGVLNTKNSNEVEREQDEEQDDPGDNNQDDELTYLDRLEFKGNKIQRIAPAVTSWTEERVKERIKSEVKSGQFGRGKVIPRFEREEERVHERIDENVQAELSDESLKKVTSVLRKMADTVVEFGEVMAEIGNSRTGGGIIKRTFENIAEMINGVSSS